MKSSASIIDRASGVNSDSENTYTREYPVHLTHDQSRTAKRWFGSVRAIRNQSRSLHETHVAGAAREKLESYVAENVFLHELPSSALRHESLSSSPTQWASRKHDVQQIVISGEDFELTPRATVTIVNLGELDVDFNEGIPEPFPTKIELLQNPAGDATVRLHYAGEFPNV
jgi:hypothetical protein